MANDSLNETVNAPKWKTMWEKHLKDNPGHAMQFTVPLPSEVLKNENFKENFMLFRRKFLHYIHLSMMVSLPEIVQVEQLLTLIGPACNKILDNLDLVETERDTVDKVFKVLENAISATENPLEWEMKFLDAKQEDDETVLDFVDRLRELAKKAELTKEIKAKLLQMKFMHGLRCQKTKQKILKKRINDLQTMVDEATAQKTVEESAMAGNQTIMAMNACSSRNFGGKTQNKRGGYGRTAGRVGYSSGSMSSRNNPGYSGGSTGNRYNGPNCKNCGGKHYPNQECPAKNRRCDFCKELGHYRKVCRRVTEIQETEPEHDLDNLNEGTDMIGSMAQTYDTSEYLYMLKVAEPRKRKRTPITGVQIRMTDGTWKEFKALADTGAGTSAINIGRIHEFGIKRETLRAEGLPVRGFGGGLSQVYGTAALRVRFENRKSGKVMEKEVLFKICDDGREPILSIDDVCDLEMVHLNFNLEIVDDEINKMVENYEDIFTGLGKLEGEVKIVVESPPPGYQTRQVPRRVPVNIRDELLEQLNNMESEGVIIKVEEPTRWCHNLVLVKRANKLRICLDPVPMNKFIKREEFQIPKLDEILPNLTKAKVFTTCDAKSGFWQLVLDRQSSIATTFWTPFGRYRWLRMPFGVSNAPEVFQRAMTEFASDLEQVVPLADDFLIYGIGDTLADAKADHNRRLKKFFEKCRQKNLKLNKSKLQLCRPQVKFFGHVLTSEGLQVDNAKVKAIRDMTAPQDCKGVARYLGMINYLTKYLPNVSTIAEPLRRLINAKEFIWGPEQQRAYESLKDIITSTPILRYYDPSKTPVVQCDASSVGLGAVLMQDSKVVEYASKALTKTEKNYAQIEKELLAIVFALRKFDQLVVGKPVIVHTDHKPLIAIVSKPLCEAPKRLQRMLMSLQRYDIKLIHKAGKEMFVADTLSRAVAGEDEIEIFTIDMDYSLEEMEMICSLDYLPISDARIDGIREETAKDEDCRQLAKMVQNGFPRTILEMPEKLRAYWSVRDLLNVQRGLLFKGDKIIIPKILRQNTLEQLHAAHQGIEKTIALARDTVYWPEIDQHIKRTVQQCITCQKFAPNNRKLPMISHPIPQYAYQKVSMDLLQIDKINWLVIVCHYSDWFEIYRMSSTTVTAIMAKCKDNFSKYGIPEEVTTDGSPFNSQELKNFAKEWNFRWNMSTPHHHEANGRAEDAVKAAKLIIKKSRDIGADMEKLILQYRNTPNKVGLSPAQRMMNRRTRNFMPITGEKLMEGGNKDVKKRLMELKKVSKKYYDRKTRPQDDLKIGQNVFVKMRPEDKMWVEGTIESRETERAYKVKVNGKVYLRDRWLLKHKYEKEPVPEQNQPPITDKHTHTTSTTQIPNNNGYQTVIIKSRTLQGQVAKPTSEKIVSRQSDMNVCQALVPRRSIELPFRNITEVATLHFSTPLRAVCQEPLSEDVIRDILNKTSILDSSLEDEEGLSLISEGTSTTETTPIVRQLANEVFQPQRKDEKKKEETENIYKTRLRARQEKK